MSKHTLGPWKYDPIYDDGSMLKERSLPARIIAGSDQDVAVFTLEGVPSYADALLIAAAPELLEALHCLTAVIGLTEIDRGNLEALEEAYDMARAAIAKAKGEQP